MTRSHFCAWGSQCQSVTRFWRVVRRRVRVYDNHGKTADRYTVVIYRTSRGATFSDIYSMSRYPNEPFGINVFSHSASGRVQFDKLDPIAGNRLTANNIPYHVLKAIESRI